MKLCIFLATLALAHVGRSEDDAVPQSVAAQSDACTGPQGTYQPGDRYCLDETTHRVCNWGGVWIDNKCPDGFKCQLLPSDNKKVQCLQYNKVTYPTGPPAGEAQLRRRRQESDACSGPDGTYQPGDRYCLDETTHRVCNWGGVWIDNKCDEGFKCQLLPNDRKKVQCLQYNKVTYPTGPPTGETQLRRRREDAQAAAVQASAPSDTCSGPAGTYQPGDRYCVDEKTHRVCNWGGVWIDGTCDEGFKCQLLPTDNKKVQCLQYNKVTYPTGPPAGQDFFARLRRLRRQAAEAAVAAAAPSDTCTGPKGTYQPGDRYCVDDKTHRVCNWGGVWIDGQCPEDLKCMQLPNDDKKIQCFKYNRVQYPTGPPTGQDNNVA